ncbi:SdpI family protein [Brachybacterium halotolerans]
MGATGSVPPNYWFGYRLPSVAASRSAWARGHRAAAIPSLLGGVSCLLGAAGLVFFSSTDDEIAAWALASAFALLFFTTIGAFTAHHAARRTS